MKRMCRVRVYPRFPSAVQRTAASRHDCRPRNRAIAASDNVSRAKNVESTLRKKQIRLETAVNAAGLFTWDWDLKTDRAEYSGPRETLFGTAKEGVIDNASSFIRQRIHPEDLDEFDSAISSAIENGGVWEQEYRMLRPDNSVCWITIQGMVISDSAGRPARVIGVTLDSTARKEAELAVLRREQEFRALVENSPDVVVRYDRERRITFANRAAAVLIGTAGENLIGVRMDDLPLSASVKQASIKAIQDAIEQGRDSIDELELPPYVYHVRFVPERDEKGRIVSALGIGRDVTAGRKESRTAARLAAIVESSDDAIMGADLEGRITSWNAAASRMFGYAADEMIGQSGKRLSCEDASEHYDNHLATVRAGIHVSAFDTVRVTKSGEIVHVSVSISPVVDRNGQVMGISVSMRDISAQKQVERAHREGERRMRTLLSNLPGMAYRAQIAPVWKAEFVSEGCLELTGYTVEDMTSGTKGEFWDRVHPEDRDTILARMRQAIAQDGRYDLMYRIHTVQGQEKWVWERGQAVPSREDNLIVEAFITDVTERVHAKEQLAWEAKVDLALAEQSRAILNAKSTEEIEESVATLACSLTSSPCGRALHIGDPQAAMGPDDVCRNGCPALNRLRSNLCQDTTAAGCQDAQRDVCMRTVARIGEEVVGHICVGLRSTQYTERDREVLERIANMYALVIRHNREVAERQRTEKLLWGVLETSPDAIVVLQAVRDDRGSICDFSELIRNPATGDLLHGDNEGTQLERLLGIRAAMRLFPEYVRVVETGVPLDREYAFDHHAGRDYFRCVAVKLGDGIAASFASMTEQHRLRDQLNHTQRLEAIGQLAGGVAHDFNNILSIIRGVSECAMEEVDDHAPVAADLQTIHRAATRAAGLTRQLLAFSRRQMLDTRVLDLNEIVGEAEKMLRRLIGEDIELTTRLASDAWPILADAGQIEQVLMNLTVNARDAMPGGGQLIIETSIETVGENPPSALVDLKPGRYSLLTVIDTGCGMRPEVQARLFEPFFTTKEAGKGTGLGLATAYGIVKQSGGAILVSSEEGKGASFTIYLPAVEGVLTAELQEERVIEEPGRQATVLVVEDEEDVRRVARRMLEHEGYRVLVAASGPEAIDLATSCGADIDLVVSDVVMPGMSGPAMAARLLELGIRPKFVFLSGYSDRILKDATDSIPSAVFAIKPFSRESLLQKIEEAMQENRLAS